MKITTKIPHRCGNMLTLPSGKRVRCLKRASFKKRAPKCPQCGSKTHWYVDNHRWKRKEAFMTKLCRCGALCSNGGHTAEYPHRMGSTPWCPPC